MRQNLPRVHATVDNAHLPTLVALSHGDARISDLAESTQTDISTISRQVATLARAQLVTRERDLLDGRVQVISLTREGHEFVESQVCRRGEWIASRLADWSDEDARTFIRLLDRAAAGARQPEP